MIQNLFNNESLTTNQMLRTPEDAKNNAAEMVLSQFCLPQQQPTTTLNATQAELNDFYNLQQQQQLKHHQMQPGSLGNHQISASDLNKQALQNAVAAAAASNAQYIIDPINGTYIVCPPQ